MSATKTVYARTLFLLATFFYPRHELIRQSTVGNGKGYGY